ncbi:MAG TPA: glycosyltransferase family 4 protein [Chryseosolibacter sp.]|nr:glycosyltransferase family 4 protein [Chryseosolibacter sp.]
MKVLLLHQHFNTPQTGGALRSYYLVRALADRGIRVIIITAYNGRRYKVEIVEGLEVHYLPVGYRNRYGFYKRTRAFLSYMARAVTLARRFHDVSLCYAISVPLTVGIAAIAVKMLYGIPYIFEVGDLWPEAPIQMGFIKNRPLKKILYNLESSIYRRASAIVALSRPIKAGIASKAPGKLVHIVENMSDIQFYHPEQKQRELEMKFGVTGKFVVGYMGTLGYANGLEHLVECAKQSLHKGLAVHFLICGDGAMLESLRAHSHRLSLTNLSFIPFQNRHGVKEVLNVTDAAFISYRSAPVLETGSPNKFFDGLAAGKLILVNFGGWVREEIENNECGVWIDRSKPDDFTEKITPFIHDRVLLGRYQRNARLLGERKYSREQLSERFVSIVRQAHRH